MEPVKAMGGDNKKKRRKRFDVDGFEAWGGYMNAKITKLEEQFDEESKKLNSSEKLSDIFKGVAIFVNGYTEPSAEDLRLLMLLHGGIYHHYFRSEKTTHVIASNLPNAKMVQLKTLKVVKPEWIVKSVEAGRLLDYKQFLLFSNLSAFEDGRKEEKNEAKPTNSEKKSAQHSIAKTAVDAQFLSEFYSNSRLHHLSTMGAMFKVYVNELKKKHDGVFQGRQRVAVSLEKMEAKELHAITEKVVMHIDMDCFFVSVALRNHPELVGKPVAVAHARGNPTHQRVGVDSKFEYEFYRHKMEAKLGLDNESDSESDEGDGSKRCLNELSSRSEVASCSYEARKAGVRNGMYLGAALKLCPALKTVPYDFEGYKEVSFTLYNTVAEYTLDIEAISCDEMFIDCTSLLRDLQIRPLAFAEMLRKDIYDRTQCPSSAGIGSNKLQARLATKRAKPNGQFHLQSEDIPVFMSDVNVYDLPGVGRTIGYKLNSLNVKTCQDLQRIPLPVLKKEFGGKTGEMLHNYSRGVDNRPVSSVHQRRSVSAEVNYGIRFNKEEEAVMFLRQLSTEVSNRLKEVNVKGRNITLKVMIRAKDAPVEAAKFLGHGACDYTTRSSKLPTPTSDPDVIAKNVISMYHQLAVPPSELRGIGIQITQLKHSKITGGIHSFLKIRKTETLKEVQSTGIKKLEVPPLSQIDQDILDDLPNDLQLEILNEYDLTGLGVDGKPSSTTSTSETEKEQLRNPFTGLTLLHAGKMISEWITTEPQPRKLDVDLMIEYACDLVRKKHIEEVDALIRCFRRNVYNGGGSESWKECCKQIVARVQSSMVAAFGKELLIDDL